MGGKCGRSCPYEVSLSYGLAECCAAAFNSPFPTVPMRVSAGPGWRGPVVRCVLGPAVMVLAGRWNWWAPRWLRGART